VNRQTDAAACGERGCDPEKRQKIIEGARAIFFSAGFDGASMDSIAKAAGVSKGTLYVYFENKNTLFEALIRDMKRDLPEAIFELDEAGDIEESLVRIALNFANRIRDPAHISLVRTVIGAVEKFPDLGLALYNAGVKRGSQRLSDFFIRQNEAGRIRMDDDPEMTARSFIDLTVTGVMRKALICNNFKEADIEDHVRHGVKIFLRAYGPR
jgi:AcrR family transcriptional regulator